MRRVALGSLVLVLGGSVAFFVAGCNAAYGPYGTWGGGYSELEVSPGIYQVSFLGRATGDLFNNPDQRRLVEFTLLRCAELTLDEAHRYFIVERFGDRSGRGASARSNLPPRRTSAYTIKMFDKKPGGAQSAGAASTGPVEELAARIKDLKDLLNLKERCAQITDPGQRVVCFGAVKAVRVYDAAAVRRELRRRHELD